MNFKSLFSLNDFPFFFSISAMSCNCSPTNYLFRSFVDFFISDIYLFSVHPEITAKRFNFKQRLRTLKTSKHPPSTHATQPTFDDTLKKKFPTSPQHVAHQNQTTRPSLLSAKNYHIFCLIPPGGDWEGGRAYILLMLPFGRKTLLP